MARAKPAGSLDLLDLVSGQTVTLTPRVVPLREAVADHHCAVCGAWGGFGFDVFLRQGRPGRWACTDHRDQVERMAA